MHANAVDHEYQRALKQENVSSRDIEAAARAYLARRDGKPRGKRPWERLSAFELRDFALAHGMEWPDRLEQVDPALYAENRELAGRLYMKHLKRQGLLPPKHERPRCGAKCRDGHACNARAVFNVYRHRMSRRCKWHGGFSTGPKSPEAKARALAILAAGRAILAQRRAPKSG